jgi:alpha-beta hydrolase superfamily lysophospholipase
MRMAATSRSPVNHWWWSGATAALKRVLLIALLALTAACAPTVQHALAGPAPEGPRYDLQRGKFVSFDGAELGLSTWLPPQGTAPWAVIVALHGMNDYANAFDMVGPWLAERGVAVYAYDARGFGRSPNRGVWAGQQLMSEDLRTAVQVAKKLYPRATLAVLGDSMGAAEAVATFGDGEPMPVDRLILVSPAVWGWSSLPDIYAMTLWAGAHTFPWREVTPPRDVQKHIVASDNIEMLRRLGRDRNMLFTTRIDSIYGLVGLMETATQRISRLDGDVAYFYGAHDMIIPKPAALVAASRLPPGARTAYYPHAYHMMLRDLEAGEVYEDVLAFLADPKAPFPSGAPPLEVPAVQANR